MWLSIIVGKKEKFGIKRPKRGSNGEEIKFNKLGETPLFNHGRTRTRTRTLSGILNSGCLQNDLITT